MSSPSPLPDLSKLRIDRDAPSPPVRRAVRRNAIFAAVVLAALVIVPLALRLLAVSLRLDQPRPRARQVGLGLRDLRLVVGVLQARDHPAALHVRAFGDAEVGEPARHLGGDRRPRPRDDVAVRGHARRAAPAGAATSAVGARRHDDGLHRDGRARAENE